jgi:(1->4)-alpha-D-glucan 1-alpha-D-glucosylmutase
LGAFADRVAAYMVKASREAKQQTSWANPNPIYEAALDRLVRGALDLERSRTFLDAARAFVRGLAPAALTNTLAQTVLRLTSPGVPDTYQGAELWDLSLVDPDNRRPVDFTARDAALQALDDALAGGTSRAALAAELLRTWPDARIKLFVMTTLLRHLATVRDWPQLPYAALTATGPAADHLVAFRRGDTIVAIPRLPHTLGGAQLPVGDAWRDTTLIVGDDVRALYRDVLTDRIVAPGRDDGDPYIRVRDVCAVLPVAVLVPSRSSETSHK